MDKRIIIAGGKGFVGSNLYHILKNNYHIKIISRSNNFDLRFSKNLEKIFQKKYDYFINCAADVGSVHYILSSPAKILYDNILICNNIYQMLSIYSPKTKIINIIANCFYPPSKKITNESDWNKSNPHHTVSGFAFSRRFLIELSKFYKKKHNINSINIVSPSMYGPGDSNDPNKTHALNGMIIRMIKNKKKIFEIWGNGKQVREWIFVQDLVRFIKLVINRNINNIELMNFGQKKFYSILDLSKKIKKELSSKSKIKFNLKFTNADPVRKSNNELFKKKFNKFKFTSIDEGIKKTIFYYKSIFH